MSYTIEYDRVFLMSGEGITPCWLSGDNNVTTGHGRYERRCRSWSVFCNMLGVTDKELERKIESFCTGSNEHWKKGSRWLDDEGLRRWVKSGIRNAYRLEDILEANRVRSVSCYISAWYGDRNKTELQTYVGSTEELDSWIRLAKAFISDMRCEGHDCYPIIQLNWAGDTVKKPGTRNLDDVAASNPDQKFLIKHGRSYLLRYELGSYSGASVTWTYKPTDAKQLSAAEVQTFIDPIGPYASLSRGCKVMKADSVVAAPWNVCIKAIPEFGSSSYVSKVNSRSISLCSFISGAKHYKDMASAQAALKRLKGRKFQRIVDFEIEVDPKVKTP